jgi:hypothetical protein
MYQVLESYQRFNQKNNMIYRPIWDPLFRSLGLQRSETQVRQIEKRVVGFRTCCKCRVIGFLIWY